MAGPSTRDRILAAGLALLEERGSTGFTGREVAKRAEVSHGAPRRYFASRQILLASIAVQGYERLREAVESAVAAAGAGPAEALRASALAYLRFAEQRPELFELMVRHDLLVDSGIRLRSTSLPMLELLESQLRAALGPAAADAPARTLELWTALHGIAVLAGRGALGLVGADPVALVDRALTRVLAG